MPMPAEPKNMRTRVDASLAEAWEAMLAEHKISQQDAVTALMRFIIEQDPLTRAMIFGQVPEREFSDLAKIVLRRLATTKSRKR